MIRDVVAKALAEARKSAGILYLAYAIMPDHLHLITDGRRRSADCLRFTNGIIARRVIDFLKKSDYLPSLLKLRVAERKNGWKYGLWQHHPDAFMINNEETLLQKVDYVHQNPVKAHLVERAEDYQHSSSRIWTQRPRKDEPLMMDIDQIEWRRRR